MRKPALCHPVRQRPALDAVAGRAGNPPRAPRHGRGSGAGETHGLHTSTNPATGEVVATFAEHTPEEIGERLGRTVSRRSRAGREEVFGPVAVRLFLGKLQEETDHDLIAAMTRRNLTAEEDRAKGPKFPVTSAVEKVLPLVGAG